MNMLKRFLEGAKREEAAPVYSPYPYFRKYDLAFCAGPNELREALQEINKEGHRIVSVTQDYSKYTIIFMRFD